MADLEFLTGVIELAVPHNYRIEPVVAEKNFQLKFSIKAVKECGNIADYLETQK